MAYDVMSTHFPYFHYSLQWQLYPRLECISLHLDAGPRAHVQVAITCKYNDKAIKHYGSPRWANISPRNFGPSKPSRKQSKTVWSLRFTFLGQG